MEKVARQASMHSSVAVVRCSVDWVLRHPRALLCLIGKPYLVQHAVFAVPLCTARRCTSCTLQHVAVHVAAAGVDRRAEPDGA